MGYRTHLTLKKQTKDTYIKKLNEYHATFVYLLNNYCIGKVYFNEFPLLPNGEKIEFDDLYFVGEYTNNGEITVKTLLETLKTLRDNKEEYLSSNHKDHYAINWYKEDYSKLIARLELFLEKELVKETDWIQFEAW